LIEAGFRPGVPPGQGLSIRPSIQNTQKEGLLVFDFEKPNIEIAEISEDKKYGKFVVEPLERGYGTT